MCLQCVELAYFEISLSSSIKIYAHGESSAIVTCYLCIITIYH